MPPRTTEESHRPQVSDRTMRCHSWWTTVRLVVSDNEWRRYTTEMESQRRAVSARTAGSRKTTLGIMRGGANSWAECRPNRIGVELRGKIFLLTFPFIGHVYTSSSNRRTLEGTQLLPQELIESFFLPLASEPQRFAGLQIAHHRQEFVLLPQIDFINSHLPQRRFPPARCPALEIANIDGTHRAGRQPELSGHSAHRCALTRQPHRFFEALAERCFAWQLRHLLRLHSAIRAAHTIQLDHYRGAKLEAGQIAHLPLVGVIHLAQFATTARTHQLAIAPFSPYP